MSNPQEVLTVAQSGNYADAENVEITGVEQCADGSWTVTMNITMPKSDATTQMDDIGSERGFNYPGETDDEDTQANDDDGKGPWMVAGTEMSHNDLQRACSKHLDEYPEDSTGDGLAEALRSAIEDTEKAVSEENEGTTEDDENDTPASGGSDDEYPHTDHNGVPYRESDTGTKWYPVIDGEKTGNGLRKAVRTSNWPDSPTVENLRRIYNEQKQAAEGSEDTETTENVSGNTAYTGEGQPDPEWLKSHGVAANIAEHVPHYRDRNGVCRVEGCEKGAADKNEPVCKDCEKEGRSPSDEIDVTYGDDRGHEVQRLAEMFGVSPMTVENALEDFNDDIFTSKKEAIDYYDS